MLKMGERRAIEQAALAATAETVRRSLRTKQRVDRAELTDRSVQALLAQLNGRIGQLQSSIGQMQGEIAQLKVRVTALEGAA